MHLIGSTILAWLNLVGWLVVSVVLWGNRQAIFPNDDTTLWVFVVLVGWMIGCTVAAFTYTERCVRLLRCRSNSRYLAQLNLDLTAPDVEPGERRLALRTLADHCGEPFGFGGIWPFVWWENWQFGAGRALLKRLAQAVAAEKVTAAAKQLSASKPVPKRTQDNASGPILEPLRRGAAETLERLSDAIKDTMMDWTPDDADSWEPAEVPLPPMQATQFAEALRAPVETVLASLAETINAATDARAVLDSREHCQELLGAFLDGALEVSLKLRVDAAMAELPALQTSGGSSLAWHAADPALRGPTRSWVEKYRRMKADDSNWF